MFSDGYGPRGVDDLAMPGAPSGRQHRRRLALVGVLIVGALALLGGGAAYALPALLPASATVTVTPRSSDLKASYTLAAVTGTPDATKQQVGARLVSVSTPAQTQTVPATGSKAIGGTHAHGTVGVLNYDTAHPLTLAAGTAFPNTPGCVPGYGSLVLVLDASVSLPAFPSSDETNPPSATVPAHVQQVGTVGNHPFLALSSLPRSPLSGCAYFVYLGGTCSNVYNVCDDIYSTGAFTGGTNPRTVTVVAQQDIDSAAQGLIQAKGPDAQQLLQGQLQPHERLVGTPQCTPRVSANHRAGDIANTVTVTVTFTCRGEAYDHDGALALAARLLNDQATNTPGTAYALVGKITATVQSATRGTRGAVQLVVSAEGLWAYQVTAPQQQTMAHLIAGKSEQEAQQVLTAQPGVSRAAIALSGGIGQTLPTDPTRITIVVQKVTGL